jgi:hypothetical protein
MLLYSVKKEEPLVKYEKIGKPVAIGPGADGETEVLETDVSPLPVNRICKLMFYQIKLWYTDMPDFGSKDTDENYTKEHVMQEAY